MAIISQISQFVRPNDLENAHKSSLQDLLWSFVRNESFGGILLFVCVVLAMIVANSPLAPKYFAFFENDLGFVFSGKYAGMSILHWINDAAMSLFFLLVGLEMKRDVLWGQLAGFRKISFSIAAALGGILLPCFIYYLFTRGTPYEGAFGVAMSTDTAFALGIILLLGKRIPSIMKIFLVTMAVADDFGAIAVIAVFYSEQLNLFWIGLAVVIFVLLCGLKILWSTRELTPYILGGVLLWFATYNSGIHATVAAVALALLIPSRPQEEKDYYNTICKHLDSFNRTAISPNKSFAREQRRAKLLEEIASVSIKAQNPLLRLEYFLQPLCAYLVVPVFAFANAGVSVNLNADFMRDGILLGVICGLVIGKPIGIFVFSFLAEKAKIAIRPEGLSYLHILGIGFIAGIGFTMSIFVANLSFSGEEENIAKIGILIASLIAAIIGSIFIILTNKKPNKIQCKG